MTGLLNRQLHIQVNFGLQCNTVRRPYSGCLGGSVRWASSFGSGRDLMAHEVEPRVGLYADSSEHGAYFGFCVSLSLCSFPACALSLSVSKINKHWGAWVAQSVKHLTSAQVTISWFHGFKPIVGLCTDSSEPGACIGFCVSPCLCPSPAHALSLSVSQ